MQAEFPILPVEYIDEEAELSRVVELLSTESHISVDLEFDNNRYRYGFTLCLIQIATQDRCYIVDPLRIRKHRSLFEVFENPAIGKIMHTPGEDLRLLHSLSCYPVHILDTEYAARLLNYENPSLANMLQTLFGITLDKQHQTSNWHTRPLSEEQLQYAAQDVVWLAGMYSVLMEKLKGSELYPVFLEEMEYLAQVRFQPPDRENLLTKSDKASLTDYEQYVLNELLKFRDRVAEEFNMPPAHVIGNTLIRSIVSGEVNLQDWKDQKGIFGGVKNDKYQRLLQQELKKAFRSANELQVPKVRTRTRKDGEGTTPELGYWDKAEIQARKEKFFKPVQAELTRRFGEHTARFLLGEGVTTDIIRGLSRLSDIRGNARKSLIKETASGLGIDLAPFG